MRRILGATFVSVSLLTLSAFQAVADTPGEAMDLRVTGYDSDTDGISISFQPACATLDHHIEFGALDAVSTLSYSGQVCGLGTDGTHDGFNPGAGSFFFLVVGNDGVGIEGSYGLSYVDGAVEERTTDLLDPLCAFVQDLTQRCDGPMVPVVQLTAYRPQSEAYGGPIQRTAVPEDEERIPGVGVRINGDDDNGNATPDSVESNVAGENDLVEVVLVTAPETPPAGIEYLLRRTDGDVLAWTAPTKQIELFGGSDSISPPFVAGMLTVWVELPQAGQADLELVAWSTGDQQAINTDEIHVFAFSSVVIALGGESQVPADPPLEPNNHGTFQLALDLYRRGYDVHMYDEDVVGANGAGAAFDEVVGAVRDRGVASVAIFGYSHGGGSTNDLARRLDDNRATIGSFSIDFTGYVDGIDNRSDFDLETETQLPPSTAYHANYYQHPGCVGIFALCGGPIAGADFDLNVTTTVWGMDLTHFSVDDAPEVTSGIRDQLLPRIPR